jgi:serine/threonine-protein kinase SRPK3
MPDLHPGNVLLALPGLDATAPEQLYRQHSQPVKEPIARIDSSPLTAAEHASLPAYAVPPGWFGKICERTTPADARILLTDFGESWAPSTRARFELCTPRWYRAPETLFARRERRAVAGAAADVWTLAAALYEVFARRALFECFAPDDDHAFADVVSTLGRPPDAWWRLWDARRGFFNERDEWDVKLPWQADGIWRRLDARVRSMKSDRSAFGMAFGKEEEEDFLRLLESMLRWQPEERVTAEELVSGLWMRKWGTPALQGMEKCLSGATNTGDG